MVAVVELTMPTGGALQDGGATPNDPGTAGNGNSADTQNTGTPQGTWFPPFKFGKGLPGVNTNDARQLIIGQPIVGASVANTTQGTSSPAAGFPQTQDGSPAGGAASSMDSGNGAIPDVPTGSGPDTAAGLNNLLNSLDGGGSSDNGSIPGLGGF